LRAGSSAVKCMYRTTDDFEEVKSEVRYVGLETDNKLYLTIMALLYD